MVHILGNFIKMQPEKTIILQPRDKDLLEKANSHKLICVESHNMSKFTCQKTIKVISFFNFVPHCRTPPPPSWGNSHDLTRPLTSSLYQTLSQKQEVNIWPCKRFQPDLLQFCHLLQLVRPKSDRRKLIILNYCQGINAGKLFCTPERCMCSSLLMLG